MLSVIVLAGPLAMVAPARADFIDEDGGRAQKLASRRHDIEARLCASFLRAAGLGDNDVARRLAAMSDEDIHHTLAAPAALRVVRVEKAHR
jgi:hypothetical protein